MTYLQLLSAWAQGNVSPVGLVKKISGKTPYWLVSDLERPGETLQGPLFKKKKDAVDYADGYISAVLARLREEEYANKP